MCNSCQLNDDETSYCGDRTISMVCHSDWLIYSIGFRLAPLLRFSFRFIFRESIPRFEWFVWFILSHFRRQTIMKIILFSLLFLSFRLYFHLILSSIFFFSFIQCSIISYDVIHNPSSDTMNDWPHESLKCGNDDQYDEEQETKNLKNWRKKKSRKYVVSLPRYNSEWALPRSEPKLFKNITQNTRNKH